jgi:hypothetical protein
MNALTTFLQCNWWTFAQQDRPLEVTIGEYKSKRSVEQNKFYWKRLSEIAEQSWISGKQFSPAAWHEMFKRLFIGMEDLPNGEKAGISTTTLDVSEFSEYIERVHQYAASELGVQFDG